MNSITQWCLVLKTTFLSQEKDLAETKERVRILQSRRTTANSKMGAGIIAVEEMDQLNTQVCGMFYIIKSRDLTTNLVLIIFFLYLYERGSLISHVE